MVNLKKEKEISKADMRKKVEAWKTINSVLVSANAEYIKSLQNILIEKKVQLSQLEEKLNQGTAPTDEEKQLLTDEINKFKTTMFAK
jgi:hypothetical protein